MLCFLGPPVQDSSALKDWAGAPRPCLALPTPASGRGPLAPVYPLTGRAVGLKIMVCLFSVATGRPARVPGTVIKAPRSSPLGKGFVQTQRQVQGWASCWAGGSSRRP